ncbi:MAG: hypothetical protein RL653_327, partial [Pseudomonadota bacterium]
SRFSTSRTTPGHERTGTSNTCPMSERPVGVPTTGTQAVACAPAPAHTETPAGQVSGSPTGA